MNYIQKQIEEVKMSIAVSETQIGRAITVRDLRMWEGRLKNQLETLEELKNTKVTNESVDEQIKDLKENYIYDPSTGGLFKAENHAEGRALVKQQSKKLQEGKAAFLRM